MDADTELKKSCINPEVYSENLEKDLSAISFYGVEEKCTKWLDSCSSDDVLSVCSKLTETSDGSLFTDTTENSEMDSGYVLESDDIIVENKICCEDNNLLPVGLFYKKSPPKYDNINIYKSRKVHIGDVTIINGPVVVKPVRSEEVLSLGTDSYYISLGILSRTEWLAQPPTSKKQFLDEPAKYVIICHTATEEGFTQAENTLLVRLIQSFHIDSRKWSDIAYNFLIGSNGRIYEGRGWNVQGAHTKNYNQCSVGISFIGCFLNHLPPDTALQKAKELIEYGLKEGYISREYRLVAHRQCSGFESPGQKLYEEIQTWDRWDSSVSVVNPKLNGNYIEEKLENFVDNVP